MAYKQNTSGIKLALKELLKDRGITSKEFAERLGVTPVTISYIITNKTTPSLDMVARMAKELNVKLSTLLGEEPLRIESNNDFAAYIRYKGIHFTADTIEEFAKIADEVLSYRRD